MITNQSLHFPLFFIIFFNFYNSLSARADDHIQYLYPQPDAERVSAGANIIVRYDRSVSTLARSVDAAFDIRGSEGGHYSGKAVLSDDNRTLIYKMDRNFCAGELITVYVPVSPLPQRVPITCKKYKFRVSNTPENIADELIPYSEFPPALSLNKVQNPSQGIGDPFTFPNGVTIPSDFPRVDVRLSDNPSPDYLLTSTFGGTPYIMILNNQGVPIYYKRMRDRPFDFKCQPNGMLTYYDRNDVNGFIVMDATYSVIDTIKAKHGYWTDDHELRILPNEHILLLATDVEYIDMSEIVDGGYSNARVLGNIIQELDRSGDVIFEWRCWDHFKLTDALHVDLTAPSINFTHMNAIDVDHDGNMIISTRNFSEITKINRNTGEIMWRFGGKNNQFHVVNDSIDIDYQHAVRVLPNGNYILFDNGNNRQPPFSRVVEYKLDTDQMIASLEWEYRHNPDYYTSTFGNAQRLNNGNTLINWAAGDNPKPVEIRPDGSKALEFMFNQWVACYRIFRSPWQGQAAVPYLVAESWRDRITLIFNRFGSQNVQHYNIYADTTQSPTTCIDTTRNTYIHLKELENHKRYFFRVTAVDSFNKESDFSNQVQADVCFSEADDNFLLNGDFSDGKRHWTLKINSPAFAVGSLSDNGEYHIEVREGGSEYSDIELVQNNVDMIESQTYHLEFDARAEQDRPADMAITKIHEPYTNYSKIGMFLLTSKKQHFSYQFTMREPSDYEAQIAFQCGGSPFDVYLDNIILKEIETGVYEKNQSLQRQYELFSNYPNPFNPTTTIEYVMPGKGHIEIKVFDLLGRQVCTLVAGEKTAGTHKVTWNGLDNTGTPVSSGVYFYTMTAEGFAETRKLLILH